MIRLEGVRDEGKRGGKAMQPSCTEPNQLDTKGKGKRKRERGKEVGKEGKKEGKERFFTKK